MKILNSVVRHGTDFRSQRLILLIKLLTNLLSFLLVIILSFPSNWKRRILEFCEDFRFAAATDYCATASHWVLYRKIFDNFTQPYKHYDETFFINFFRVASLVVCNKSAIPSKSTSISITKYMAHLNFGIFGIFHQFLSY